MKALVYTGACTLDIRDEPKPRPQADETLVRVDAAGICGSDLHAWHGHDERRVPPLILGHELAGTVVDGPMAGQRVAINPLVGCGRCRDCLEGEANLCSQRDLLGLGRPGGFAEFVAAPTSNLFALPDDLGSVEASLMEPTAVAVHAVALAERLARRPVSESPVLVIGGGAIGVLAALILRDKGVPEMVIAETAAPRRAMLEGLGFADVINPIDTPARDNHFDLVVDAVGSGATRRDSSRCCRSGGVISHIGLQDNKDGLDTRRLTLAEIVFAGNYTYTPRDLTVSLDLLRRGALGSLDWVETRPLDAGAASFETLAGGTATAAKIILLPESQNLPT